MHLLSSDETLKILIQNETLKFLITCAIPGLMNLNVVEVQIFIYFQIINSSTLDYYIIVHPSSTYCYALCNNQSLTEAG